LLPAYAQAPTQAGPAKQAAEKPPETRQKKIEVGVEMRWRFEFRDNADFRPTDDFDAFTGQRIRLHVLARVHPDFSLFIQVQDSWVFDCATDKIIHDLATNLHQAYFDWKVGGSSRWQLRGGRQELAYGEERLVGTFGWDTVGRSFDGGRVRYQQGAWSSDFFWARLVNVRRAGAPARRGDQDLSGVYATRVRSGSPRRTEVYGLFLHDALRTTGELPGGTPETVRIFTSGFRHVYQPKTGWRYSVEHAWQFGERGPDAHLAAMLIGTLGHVWGGRWQPRLQFEYDFGSGDNNPTDGKSREFHNLFPSNHSVYGYADLLGLRNVHDFRFTAATSLHPKATLEFDYHHFLLAAPRGPWKNAGGRVLGFDPTGNSGRDLGHEIDLTLRLPVHKHAQFLAGYSVFLPGRFVERTRGSDPHQFAYLQTIVRF
jgi:hypothetical protein